MSQSPTSRVRNPRVAAPVVRGGVAAGSTERLGGLGHLSGLDGLRAIAVAAVLLYHAGLLAGGFLGVDVFFVISGFLITALLLTERRQTGRIDVKRFWLRRARRLLPALFLVLISVLLFVVLFVPSEVARIRAEVLAAAVYVTNWFLILGQQSYFQEMGRQSPLKHLWSLAVEEQFYVLWPLLLAALLIVPGAIARLFANAGDRLHVHRHVPPVDARRWAFVAVIALAMASTVWMAILYDPTADPSRVYYGTDTRIAGLLTGAALAFIWLRRPTWRNESGRNDGWRSRSPAERLKVDLFAIAGFAVIAAFLLNADDYAPLLYSGGFAVVSVATAVVIAAVIHPASHIGPLILDRRPIRWVGERSYGIYLWHWPIYMFTRPNLDVAIDGPANVALRLGLTLVLAEISYRFVENPIRRGAVGAIWRDWRRMPVRERRSAKHVLIPVGVVLALTVAALGSQIVRATPPPVPAYLAVQSIDLFHTPSPPPTTAPTPTASPTLPQPTGTIDPTATAAPTATIPAAPKPTPPVTQPPLVAQVYALGDSVMLGAAPSLAADISGCEVDAAVGRHWYQGITLISQRAAAGRLSKIVVIDLGNNDHIYDRDFDAMMVAVGPNRTAIFVNLRLPRDYETRNNQTLANGVARYPNAVLVDWHGASDAHPEYFYDDGMHLRPLGQKVFAALVRAAVSTVVP